MSKTFELPDSANFTVSATGDSAFTLELSKMDNESLLKGLLRGLKNICGDAVGAKTLSHKERVEIIESKIARFESGDIGDGVSSVSDYEKEMRLLFAAWLTGKGVKSAEASKLARSANVESTFLAIVEKKGLDTVKAAALFDAWTKKAESIVAMRGASEDIAL
jgi:hypothetical protein